MKMKVTVEPKGPLRGELVPPADKSISHRAAILAGIADGKSIIRNYLEAADTSSTLAAMIALGAEAEIVKKGGSKGRTVVIRGRGLHGLKEPGAVLDCGNSGTTMRLLAGLLSGNPFYSVMAGDESLSCRPMGRVIVPLKRMGARIMARQEDKYPPVSIRGGGLKGISYEMPVASAQVKSALLLAGLYAEGKTVITEPFASRDHTERMLSGLGAAVETKRGAGGRNTIKLTPPEGPLKPFELEVPGDFSSAAFFIIGALITGKSELLIKNVGINPRRTGLLSVLERMGAGIGLENKREVSGEPVADIHVKHHGALSPFRLGGKEIPLLVDEVPVLCVAAAMAQGTSRISGAGELRVKESDRISAMAEGLRRMGIRVEEAKDGLSIEGGPMTGAGIESMGDHRIAMAFSIAALAARGKTRIDGAEAVGISYPGFFSTLRRLLR
ncbi:MAG: 3-phosphoshikimate 1-carboxyvinyltransferase [Nitrospiraceae bacterium]|nr:3-phosphoshikimate 1-carboxyvinyltransferase [Nitrospiraceae bacterium]